MTFGSLFSGIGGIDLGLTWSGMSCKWQVEIDDYCRKVLAKHWPNVERFEDVTKVGKSELGKVDLIAGGFPCQDISYAGAGAGLSGDRSGLFYELVRIVRELEPRFVLLENVAALLTRGIDDVLGTLASIGFDAEWHCLQAANFGAPHLRDRIFIGCSTLADTTGKRQQGQGESEPSIRSKKSENRQAIGAESSCQQHHWTTEPAVGRVANGISHRVDRLRGLGNAVVPQTAQWIGERIMECDNAT